MNLFNQEVNNTETIAANKAVNDRHCLQKRIENFSLAIVAKFVFSMHLSFLIERKLFLGKSFLAWFTGHLQKRVYFACSVVIIDLTLHCRWSCLAFGELNIGGSNRVATGSCPLRVPILSFWHADFSKDSCVRSWHLPTVSAVPLQEILDPPLINIFP